MTSELIMLVAAIVVSRIETDRARARTVVFIIVREIVSEADTRVFIVVFEVAILVAIVVV